MTNSKFPSSFRSCTRLLAYAPVPAAEEFRIFCHADAPTLEELGTFLEADGLARIKVPERLEVIDAMPLNPTGKILKRVLRARFDSGASPSSP